MSTRKRESLLPPNARPQPRVSCSRSQLLDRLSVSAERECKSLHARIDEFDLEQAISDGLGLSDQLIQPLLANRAVALLVDVNSVSGTRRLSIDEHAKSHGSSWHRRPHDEMKIAGVKAVRDPPVGLVQYGELLPHRPV